MQVALAPFPQYFMFLKVSNFLHGRKRQSDGYASLYLVLQCVAETAAAQIVETRSRQRNSKPLMNLIRIPHRRKHSGLRRIMKNLR